MSAQDSPHLILVIWDDGGGEVNYTRPGWEAKEVEAIKRQVEHSLSFPDLEMGHIDIMLRSETVVANRFRYMGPFTNVRVLDESTLLPVFQETVRRRSSSGRQVIACVLSYLPLEGEHPSTFEALKSNPDIHSIHFWHKKHAWTRQSFSLQDSQISVSTSTSQRSHTPSSHGDAVKTPDPVKVASTSSVVNENADWTAEGELRKKWKVFVPLIETINLLNTYQASPSHLRISIEDTVLRRYSWPIGEYKSVSDYVDAAAKEGLIDVLNHWHPIWHPIQLSPGSSLGNDLQW